MIDILHACHDGPCGGNFSNKRTTYKVLHSGYYWSSIFKDASKYVKGFDSFQRMGILTSPEQMALQPQVMIKPFEKWAIYFVGPISSMYRKKKYILVCTDYVTKWVEAKDLFQARKKYVVEFIYEEIFTQFGVLRGIVTDQGPQFTSKLMKELTTKYGIEHCKYSPYQPQANHQIESTNRVL